MDHKSEKPLILIICDYYLPGFESGGAMRTLVNMVDRLNDEFDFRVITRDHDGPNNLMPYESVKINEWNRVGKADVYYLSRENIRPGNIRRLIMETGPAAVYVNSFFSSLTIFTLLLRRFGKIGKVPVILAPEGELVPGGLRLKPLKKRLYIAFAKSLQLLKNVVWKAAAESEQTDVENIFGKDCKIFIAPNMPPNPNSIEPEASAKPEKHNGAAEFVFLSRIMRKKNLNWFLEKISGLDAGRTIELDVYGPVEDDEYFEETQHLLKNLPENVIVRIRGPVPNDKVSETLEKYHFFVLPTLGENFGHIFVEAMAAGCPLVISDRSPWRELESKHVGWDIPLEDPQTWLRVIKQCVDMDNDEYQERSEAARDFAIAWLTSPTLEESNRAVLRYAVQSVDHSHR
jgi:glycosyltransferase involved in cell wall biosynthesis